VSSPSGTATSVAHPFRPFPSFDPTFDLSYSFGAF
jgi:hypothetical protein